MKTKSLIALFTVLVALTGCYKEDYSTCPDGRYVFFESVTRKYDYAEVVESADLYLYNNAGRLVNKYEYTLAQVKADGGRLLLPFQPEGEYTLVAVVNGSKDHYDVSDADNTSSGKLSLKCNGESVVETMPCDIYHSCSTITFDRYSVAKTETDILDLFKNTNDFHVKVKFVNDAAPAGELQVYMCGNNGTYGYDNKLVEGSYRKYKTHQYSPEDNLYTMRTMRVHTNTDLMLHLELWPENTTKADEAEPLRTQTIDIREYLMGVKDTAGNCLYDTDEKLEQEDRFNIVVTLRSNFEISGITINDWAVISPGEEL